ncbi:DNA methyltransferase [Desulfonatronospira sp.]|uniref:DNA methyltransferase n=1 Tax=Desulfonatronospira sp. TaxID=1962951 RepID=UPI0025C18757|nr:DNA methyltransferase [Desulfonatronospira sp.]
MQLPLQDQEDKQSAPRQPVECLGMTFAHDQERRNYFLDKLSIALQELKEKLQGVPFSSLQDTIDRLESLQHWPFGHESQVQELAQKMAEAAGSRRGDNPGQTPDLLQLFKDEIGFPHGKDEDILALSDPPYYTACPNPFIPEFIRQHGRPYDPETDDYHREPFATDVSEGKNDPIYNAHSYHTKVPHKAIMRYILHYTEPGDVVFDGFCGTGMTGVAAQLCADRQTVESLGYHVDKQGVVYQQETGPDGKAAWKPFSRLGTRSAVLSDLSPAATFIAYNYNTPVDVQAFEQEAKRILKEVEEECGWMYTTLAYAVSGSKTASQDQQEALATIMAEKLRACKSVEEIRKLLRTQPSETDVQPVWGQINYTVWSDVYICPECAQEVVFWEAAVDKTAGKVHSDFPCPVCNALLTKRKVDRAWVTKLDKAIGQTIRQAKQIPVLINYSVGKIKYEKRPDIYDFSLIDKIEQLDIPYWFPTYQMMFKGKEWGDTWRSGVHAGITHVHHFYSRKNLWIIASFVYRLCRVYKSDLALRLLFIKTASERITSRLASIAFSYFFHGGGGFINAGTKGTLYVSSTVPETPAYISLKSRLSSINWSLPGNGRPLISTQSTTKTSCNTNGVDYIFIDPPFGGNLMYSELSFLWESWLKNFTNIKPEAITNNSQAKGLSEYQSIMTKCFCEYYRLLKPGRWMTVEFHNSKNSVWNSIQESLQSAGFVIADIRTLDKKQGSFKQYTSASAVKQDLIISAYKPNGGLEDRFQLQAGTEEGVWEFVRNHLKQLPVFVTQGDAAEAVAERQNYLLFDRMIAFHVQRGVSVPMSAAEFYQGLAQRFDERDGMYFLPEQAAEYDRKRRTIKKFRELTLMVIDEASAIQWLKQQLSRKPQTFQDLHPQFMKEIGGWQKHEKMLELSDLLEQNFLIYNEGSPIPAQIVSWMKQSEELRSIIAEETEVGRLREDQGALHIEQTTPQISKLISRARSRWYVPNPHRAADLEKLREKSLLKEFEEYRQFKGRKMKQFRLEAVRAGFKKAWQDRDYQTIIKVAEKIPEKVLQEDPKLLMWYDQAVTRVGN